MRKNWKNGFRNVFQVNVEIFTARMTILNYLRKGDAHAATISDGDMDSFKRSMSWLEDVLKTLS